MKSRIIFPCESSIPFAFELKNVGNIFADFLESLGKVASDKAPKAATPKVDVVTYSPEHVLKMLGWENVDWDEVVRNMYLD